MTGAVCTQLPALVSTGERERRADRFVELLDCLADVLVETRGERQRIRTRTSARIRVCPRRSSDSRSSRVRSVMLWRTPPESISRFSTFD
jgi:hypothetical protein